MGMMMKSFFLHAIAAALPGLVIMGVAHALHRKATLRRRLPPLDVLSDEDRKLLAIMTRPHRLTWG
jgi:hypothetical protein